MRATNEGDLRKVSTSRQQKVGEHKRDFNISFSGFSFTSRPSFNFDGSIKLLVDFQCNGVAHQWTGPALQHVGGVGNLASASPSASCPSRSLEQDQEEQSRSFGSLEEIFVRATKNWTSRDAVNIWRRSYWAKGQLGSAECLLGALLEPISTVSKWVLSWTGHYSSIRSHQGHGWL